MDLIEKWKAQPQLSSKKRKRLVQRMKQYGGKRLDQLADKHHNAVFAELDCLQCANCCKSIPPIVNKTDATRLAKLFNLSPLELEQKYLTVDEDGDTVMNTSPCPFLMEDNRCFVYDHRPRACRQYPHTDQHQFSSNFSLHPRNEKYCPGVYHILNRMEKSLP